MVDIGNLEPEIINSIFNELSIEEKINRPIAYLMYIFFSILHGKPQIGAKLLYEAKAIYERDKNLKDKKYIHKLCNAIILTSQGIPFLHSGVEFWQGGKKVAAPWVQNPQLWMQYSPKSLQARQ
jgi:hypothetical protein